MDYIEAQNYDRGMWLLERFSLSRLRGGLLRDATGQVLEIGAGTGVNLTLYGPDVTVTAVDMRPVHLAAAARKAQDAGRQHLTAVSCADAQYLPFPDHAFDTVVGTLVFCSIAHPETALAEIQRVLRPGGRLLLLEHVRGQKAVTRRLTDLLHPVWFAMQGECHLNRETADAVTKAGFQVNTTSSHAQGVLQIIRATAPL